MSNQGSGERLPASVKLAYGAGEMGPAMAGSTMIFFQFMFLTTVAGLNPSLAGSVLLVGKIWDAINDPLAGWLSDHTRSRFGRRLPWIAGSILPFSLLFLLQWWVPPFARVEGASQWLVFWYYVGVSVLFNTAYTALTLPHQALTPELTHDYDERSRISGFRQAFSIAGSLGGFVIAIPLFKFLGQAPLSTQWFAYGAVISLVGVVSMVWCLLGIWRTALGKVHDLSSEPPVSEKLSYADNLRIVWANKPYLMVCVIYLFSWMALQFTATILPLYVENWMRLPETKFALPVIVQGTALLFIPIWGILTVRLGKKAVYLLGMPFWLVAQAGLLVLQPGQTSGLFVLAALAGLGVSVCYLIPNAMLPDTVEYDELRTGQRREGIFYGFFVFLQKVALAFGTFLVGQALGWAGFIATKPGAPAPVQPESALVAIKFAIGPLPAICLVLGMVVAALYPLTKQRHAEILAQLDERRRGGTKSPVPNAL